LQAANCLFLAIDPVLHVQNILQGGPLQRGQISGANASYELTFQTDHKVGAPATASIGKLIGMMEETASLPTSIWYPVVIENENKETNV
jgi:hypothetical protein